MNTVVNKIIEEIDRLQETTMDANHNFTSDYNQGFYDGLSQLELFLDKMKEESVSENLEEAAFKVYPKNIGYSTISDQMYDYNARDRRIWIAGAQWQKENFWKDAQGDDLPEIDRGVIVLCQPYPCEGNEYIVSYAHRPPERWYGRNLDGEEHVFEPKTYDKGEWNIPNVVWWLDLELPKKGE